MKTILFAVLFVLMPLTAFSQETSLESSRSASGITFRELPIELQFIALCESGGRQSARGSYGEVGIMQLYPKYHLEPAKKLGFDIYNPNENMAYALSLYKQEGLTPWLSSSRCWSRQVAIVLKTRGVS